MSLVHVRPEVSVYSLCVHALASKPQARTAKDPGRISRLCAPSSSGSRRRRGGVGVGSGSGSGSGSCSGSGNGVWRTAAWRGVVCWSWCSVVVLL